MRQYGLTDHVFICNDGDYIVLLDLRQDRYFALDAARAAALGTLVRGWPGGSSSGAHAGLPAEPASPLAASLLRQGILTDRPTSGKEATPVQAPAPVRDLVLDDDPAASQPVGLRTVLSFSAAAITARWLLRALPFEHVVQRVRRRSRAQAGRGPGSDRVLKALRPAQANGAALANHSRDVERSRQLVAQFMRLRVFFFSSRNECLYDSLALLEFLARRGVFPSWVFGVQTRPFAAHCWVQNGDLVLNDTVEHVRSYTPIMAV